MRQPASFRDRSGKGSMLKRLHDGKFAAEGMTYPGVDGPAGTR